MLLATGYWKRIHTMSLILRYQVQLCVRGLEEENYTSKFTFFLFYLLYLRPKRNFKFVCTYIYGKGKYIISPIVTILFVLECIEEIFIFLANDTN